MGGQYAVRCKMAYSMRWLISGDAKKMVIRMNEQLGKGYTGEQIQSSRRLSTYGRCLQGADNRVFFSSTNVMETLPIVAGLSATIRNDVFYFYFEEGC